jgi:hypothetical protein
MRKHRILAALAVFALVCSLGLGAQSKGALVVQSNISGAQVYADGRLIGNAIPNFTILLPPRTYSIKVSKAGYRDFLQTITLTSAGVTIQANLVPLGQAVTPPPAPLPPPKAAGVNLSVNSNVNGSEVYLSGNLVGRTPLAIQCNPGPYVLMVKANGFTSFTQNINLTANAQFNVTLTPSMSSLSVNANVQGADVLINGNLAGRTPYSAQLVPGSYNVIVRMAGYNDFSQTVNVSGAAQVNANLVPMMSSLSVNANIQGADVLINGNLAGKTPLSVQLVPGSYTVTVRMGGYNDYSQTLNVSGASQVNANLTAMNFPVSIDSGAVRGAQVFLNGSMVGLTPFAGTLAPGSYNLVIKALGYADYGTQLQVNGPQNVAISLVPQMATWQLVVGVELRGMDLKQNQASSLQIFVDGELQRSTSGQIPAGRHILRVVSGILSAETAFDAVSGRNYSFEPFMGLSLKQ